MERKRQDHASFSNKTRFISGFSTALASFRLYSMLQEHGDPNNRHKTPKTFPTYTQINIMERLTLPVRHIIQRICSNFCHALRKTLGKPCKENFSRRVTQTRKPVYNIVIKKKKKTLHTNLRKFGASEWCSALSLEKNIIILYKSSPGALLIASYSLNVIFLYNI